MRQAMSRVGRIRIRASASASALGGGRAARAGRGAEHPRSWRPFRCGPISSGASITTYALHYVGHAEKWDAVEIDGSLAARNCTVTYKRGGLPLAVVTIGPRFAELRAELAMEQLVLS
jgi:N-methylhydantoinase A/oxoprolinase/acetone carboxylase beta subunit